MLQIEARFYPLFSDMNHKTSAIIETERLFLRPQREEDAEALSAMRRIPTSTRLPDGSRTPP